MSGQVLVNSTGWQTQKAVDMDVVNRSGSNTTPGTMLLCDTSQSNAATTNVTFGDLASIWVNVVSAGNSLVVSWIYGAPAVMCPTVVAANAAGFRGRLYGIISAAEFNGTRAQCNVASALAAQASGYALNFSATGATQAAGNPELQGGAPTAATRVFGFTLSANTNVISVQALDILWNGNPCFR